MSVFWSLDRSSSGCSFNKTDVFKNGRAYNPVSIVCLFVPMDLDRVLIWIFCDTGN